MPVTRVSLISSGLNKISQSLLDEIADKRATHVTLHSNQICSLEVKGNNAIHLNHLIDLDLSSNALHKGYTFANHRATSMLGCCTNLVKLHLGNNEFTSKSLEVFVNSSPILSCLTSLDISHNNISKLPSTLKEKFPSLKHLTALSNRIQSLSSLLNVLHRHRGVLESLTLTNRKGSSNPVCNATLYREKVIFVLGDNLTQLDSRNVSLEERKKARKRLSIYSGVNSHDDDNNDDDNDDGRLNESESKQNHPQQQQQQQPSYDCNTTYQSSYTNKENTNQNSSDVDQKVEFLSSLIEKQARITSGLIEVTQNRNNDEIELCAKNEQDGNGSHSDIDDIQVQVETALETIELRRKAASTLVENVLIKDEQRRTLVRTALTQWRLLTRFNSHVTLFKSRFTKSETKWRGRANDLVAEAVKREREKGIVALRKVEEEKKDSEESILKLNKRVLELESSLQSERDKYASFVSNTTDESDRLRTDLQKARVTIKQMDEELTRNAKTASVEIESVRDELQHTLKGLEKEKERNTRLQSMVSQISSATEEARNTVTANSAELHDLKMQVISKDTLIEQLKNSLEKAATRAASDRSKCEQLASAERQRGETLKTYTKKLRDLEADKQKLMTIRSDLDAIVSKKESKVTSLQQIVRENTSTISNLKASIEERDCKLDSMERRLKYVSEERDDIQRKISESNQARMQLQSLLDQAHDEVQKYKRSSSQEHEMETMKLQQALDALRQTSQLREQELSAKLMTLRQKSQETKEKEAKLIKSLGNKLKDAVRSHRTELEESKRHRQHEMTTLQETLVNESECLYAVSVFVYPSSVLFKSILTSNLLHIFSTLTQRELAARCRKEGCCTRIITESTKVENAECDSRSGEGIYNILTCLFCCAVTNSIILFFFITIDSLSHTSAQSNQLDQQNYQNQHTKR